jgi:hypothetical protein
MDDDGHALTSEIGRGSPAPLGPYRQSTEKLESNIRPLKSIVAQADDVAEAS